MELASSSTADIVPPVTLRSVGRRRQRVALSMAALTLAAYFLFVLSVAYFKTSLSVEIVPGLSMAILVGVSSVVFVLVLTFAYVLWVSRVHDAAVQRLMQGGH